MSVLTAPPFSLTTGAPIYAIVQAQNTIGLSLASLVPTTYATVITPPTVAPTLSKGSGTSDTSIDLDWTLISTSPANGGAGVTGYKIYHDTQISGNLISTESSSTTHKIVNASPTAGNTYNYIVSAVNAYGEGVASSVFSIQASTVPDQITPAVSSTLDGSTVKFTWTASPNNRSNDVTGYIV